MSEGSVVQSGTYQQLMEEEGDFARLVNTFLSKDGKQYYKIIIEHDFDCSIIKFLNYKRKAYRQENFSKGFRRARNEEKGKI